VVALLSVLGGANSVSDDISEPPPPSASNFNRFCVVSTPRFTSRGPTCLLLETFVEVHRAGKEIARAIMRQGPSHERKFSHKHEREPDPAVGRIERLPTELMALYSAPFNFLLSGPRLPTDCVCCTFFGSDCSARHCSRAICYISCSLAPPAGGK
jgi:hypothetical protein